MSPLPPRRKARKKTTGGTASKKGGKAERDYTVRAVERVCSILNLLQESADGASLNDVARTTTLPKSSAFRYLWTLENHRYVEREGEDGKFRLGLGFVGMQSRHLEVLRERTRFWLEKLRDDHDETANLGVLEGTSVVYVDIVESKRSVRLAASSGDRDLVHSTALGKAIAAHLPEEQVREILTQSGMEARTTNTITTIDAYLEELAKVRRVGFAVDNGENDLDGRCVAVPLLGTGLPAAISLSAPAARFPMKDVEEAAKALIKVTAEITKLPAQDAASEKAEKASESKS